VPRVAAEFSFEQAREPLDLMVSRSVAGKTLLRIEDSLC
jgi:hypothetical protein